MEVLWFASRDRHPRLPTDTDEVALYIGIPLFNEWPGEGGGNAVRAFLLQPSESRKPTELISSTLACYFTQNSLLSSCQQDACHLRWGLAGPFNDVSLISGPAHGDLAKQREHKHVVLIKECFCIVSDLDGAQGGRQDVGVKVSEGDIISS